MVFGANKVVFRANEVVFGANEMVSGGKFNDICTVGIFFLSTAGRGYFYLLSTSGRGYFYLLSTAERGYFCLLSTSGGGDISIFPVHLEIGAKWHHFTQLAPWHIGLELKRDK